MSSYMHPNVQTLLGIGEMLEQVAVELARQTRKQANGKETHSRRGATLRPGADTPLWNALVPMVKARLKRRGDRALLARELDIHRSRIGEFFDRQSAMPDAERTLLLLLWLARPTDPAPQEQPQT